MCNKWKQIVAIAAPFVKRPRGKNSRRVRKKSIVPGRRCSAGRSVGVFAARRVRHTLCSLCRKQPFPAHEKTHGDRVFSSGLRERNEDAVGAAAGLFEREIIVYARCSARLLGQSAHLLFGKVDEFRDEGKRHAFLQHAPDRLELRQFDAFFASFFSTFFPTFFSPFFSSFSFEFPDFLLQIGQHFVRLLLLKVFFEHVVDEKSAIDLSKSSRVRWLHFIVALEPALDACNPRTNAVWFHW